LTFGVHDHSSPDEPATQVVFVRDSTGETKAAEAAALEVKTDEHNVIDRVTGLPDRRAFHKKLAQVLSEAQADKQFDFAVVCLDLDGLGLVNDTLGSHAGDLLLQTIANRLKHTVSSTDTLCRIGGDEFGVLLRGIQSEEHATSLISRLPLAIGDQVDLLGLEVLPTATVGAAIGHAGYGDAEEIIRRAEAACRHAVKGGKGAVQIVHGPATKGHRKTLRLNSDMRRALDRNEFDLHYQPIIPLRPESPRGFEALIRWSHPDFGSIGPSDFIPLAEATGAIVPIGLWVLRQACYRLVAWHGAYPDLAQSLVMSVNVSMRQLRERDLVEQLRTVLSETGAAPEALKLEITESAVMENPAEAEHLLGRLKDLGVSLWVDDFGTGYSSLAYLQRFPIDGLKIDRSFVSPVGADPNSQQIATSIIELGHNLGLSVVAEGVETAEQLQFLEKSGCDLAQGRYFSAALDEAAANAFLARAEAEKLGASSFDTVQDSPAVTRFFATDG
jgi:diguanylate cyclase (GGDEF)-like protein